MTYQSFLKSILYLLLVGQLWVNVLSYCCWMIDSESERIELCSSVDNESEEEDNKKEKDDWYRADLHAPKFEISISVVKILHLECFPSNHHPEITTPPPEFPLS